MGGTAKPNSKGAKPPSLVLLQLSPEHEHPVPVRAGRDLLHVAHALEPLRTPALRDDDVDLEPVADLFMHRERSISAETHADGREEGWSEMGSETHLDVALRRARKRVDDDGEDI